MVVINDIPRIAIIFESVIAIFILIISIIVFRRYLERRKTSTFYLFLVILFYALAVWASNIGKILDFNSDTTHDVISYSEFSINIAYSLVGIANIFLYALIENIFIRDSKERKVVVAGLFGLLIGAIIDLNSFDQDTYSSLFPLIGIFILLSFGVYSLLVYYAIAERRKSDNKKVRLGFLFIALFGVFLFGIFVFFAIDILSIQLTGQNYSIGYYLVWISAGLAIGCAYIGFTMPRPISKLFGVDTA